MPALLSHLNVRESEWTSIYDYAIGVVERAMTRDIANKELDDSTAKVRSSFLYLVLRIRSAMKLMQ